MIKSKKKTLLSIIIRDINIRDFKFIFNLIFYLSLPYTVPITRITLNHFTLSVISVIIHFCHYDPGDAN